MIKLLLFVALTAIASAQPTIQDSLVEKPAPRLDVRPLVFGALFTPSSTLHSASFSVKAGSDDCGIYESATQTAFAIDAFALWRVPSNPRIWITGRAGYRDLAAHLLSNETQRPFENQFENEISIGTMATRYDVERAGVELAIGAEYRPIEQLRLGIAPNLLYASTGTSTQTDSLITPREARFSETGLWTRPFNGGTTVDFNPVVFGLELTAGTSFPMADRLAAYPSVRLSASLTPHASNVDWRTWSVGISLGLGYDVGRRDTIPIAVAPVIPPRKPYLKASIVARGIDANGNEYLDPIIEIEETPWVEVVPILPYIFFDSAASTIASRYTLLNDPQDSRRFSVDSLLSVSPLDLHWQTLNVIGRRLRDNPAVTGVITGTGSRDEVPAKHPGLRSDRAEVVRRYLASIWGIDRSRLATATSAVPAVPSEEDSTEGRAENRRVEFSFSDPRILEPVTIHRLASIASPPAVRFTKEIVADSAIVEWSLAVVQGEKELLRFEGSGDEESLKQNKLWSLADLRINRDLSEIRYRLEVRDVTGQTIAADGRFRVVQRTRTKGGNSLAIVPTLVEHFLVGFNYNSAELLPVHRTRIDEIARTILPDDELLLVGYTDRVGARERNRQLALERAQNVYNALRQSPSRDRLPKESLTTVRGYGPQEELFDNTLPEGRMFSRMTRFVITSYRDD